MEEFATEAQRHRGLWSRRDGHEVIGGSPRWARTAHRFNAARQSPSVFSVTPVLRVGLNRFSVISVSPRFGVQLGRVPGLTKYSAHSADTRERTLRHSWLTGAYQVGAGGGPSRRRRSSGPYSSWYWESVAVSAAISRMVERERRSPCRYKRQNSSTVSAGSRPTATAYPRTQARAYSPRGQSVRSLFSKASSSSGLTRVCFAISANEMPRRWRSRRSRATKAS